MSKISLTAQDIIILKSHAIRAGTLQSWAEVAEEWMLSASKQIAADALFKENAFKAHPNLDLDIEAALKKGE